MYINRYRLISDTPKFFHRASALDAASTAFAAPAARAPLAAQRPAAAAAMAAASLPPACCGEL